MGKLTEIIAVVGKVTEPQPLPDGFRRFLSESGVADAIQQNLTTATSTKDVELLHGCITVIASHNLQALNNDELYRPWFDCGYFTIASGACGDPICLDVRTGQMAYILHEEMDHLAPNLIPSDHVIHTPLTYDQFWQRIEDGERVACDADRAEEEWGRPVRCLG